VWYKFVKVAYWASTISLLIGFAENSLSLQGQKDLVGSKTDFESYHWKYILLTWKTWRQGEDHTRINGGRNCKKLWCVLNNFLDACDINFHSLSCTIYLFATKLGKPKLHKITMILIQRSLLQNVQMTSYRNNTKSSLQNSPVLILFGGLRCKSLFYGFIHVIMTLFILYIQFALE